jgi:hypothetical protein
LRPALPRGPRAPAQPYRLVPSSPSLAAPCRLGQPMQSSKMQCSASASIGRACGGDHRTVLNEHVSICLYIVDGCALYTNRMPPSSPPSQYSISSRLEMIVEAGGSQMDVRTAKGPRSMPTILRSHAHRGDPFGSAGSCFRHRARRDRSRLSIRSRGGMRS